MYIDAIKRAKALRKNIVNENEELLVAEFSNTLLGKDTSKIVDLIPVVGTKDYVFRAKVNAKEFDYFAAKQEGIGYMNPVIMNENEIENFAKNQEFDFALWFKNYKDFDMRKINYYNIPFILQVAGCNFHNGGETGGCGYCFVDDKLNDGKMGKNKTYLKIEDAIQTLLGAREDMQADYQKLNLLMDPKLIRISGGEPSLALDWILKLWDKIGKRNLDFVGSIDTNLSTGRLIDEFERQGIFKPYTLEKLVEHPVTFLGAIKGVDDTNLVNNVNAKTTVNEQVYSIKKMVDAKANIFFQMYNPNPETLEVYLDMMDRKIENFSLKLHIGNLKLYGPNRERMIRIAEKRGVEPLRYINDQVMKWKTNYNRSVEVLDDYLRKNIGVEYKQVVRSDVELKILS